MTAAGVENSAGRERSAVILSGGGAYGAYEIGVMKALLKGLSPATRHQPLDVDIFTGTSVGAVNAAVMVSQPGVPSSSTIEYLERIWLEQIADSDQRCGNGVYRFRGDLLRYFDTQCINPLMPLVELTEDGSTLAQEFIRRGLNFLRSPGSLQTRALEFVDLSAFVSSEPLVMLVRQIISLEGIRRSEKALRIVATNWATGAVKIFENRDVTDEYGYQIILSSTAIPGFFPPQYVAGEPYVDGGVVMNTPLKCAIRAGATSLHVIYLDPDVSNIPLKVLQNTYNTLDRTLLITNATITNEDIDTAAWINEGLAALEHTTAGEEITSQEMLAFIRVAAKIQESIRKGVRYMKLTIHRYHPHRDPGGGGLGTLNFNRDRMLNLIELGYQDTIQHDCRASHCILPT
jgi:NTE family protein